MTVARGDPSVPRPPQDRDGDRPGPAHHPDAQARSGGQLGQLAPQRPGPELLGQLECALEGLARAGPLCPRREGGLSLSPMRLRGLIGHADRGPLGCRRGPRVGLVAALDAPQVRSGRGEVRGRFPSCAALRRHAARRHSTLGFGKDRPRDVAGVAQRAEVPPRPRGIRDGRLDLEVRGGESGGEHPVLRLEDAPPAELDRALSIFHVLTPQGERRR